MKKLSRIFIANRGEIAGRIALAAKKYGLESVCLYSGNHCPGYLSGIVSSFIHVEQESPALYLDQEQMIQFALNSGCDGIHPGFGFLSENASFAAKVKNSGLIWIGPESEAISAMASKAAARQLALDSGVPCLPGLQDVDGSSTDKTIDAFITHHGFPILLKAALGGGGKGMRVIRNKNELHEGMQRAASEALNAFGDASLIVEKFLENPRHVEVQILGDQHGVVKSIGDRDCSLQRRHQKIIEEAPAPFLQAETRRKMHEAAVSLAKKVGYYSAGTVEFLVETNPQNGSQNFYFLEMNTRLQVEHPVTEEVYGCDLVQWQFKIAEGESIADLEVNRQGHSIEARIYAEDPSRDFFPSPGKVQAFHPYREHGIRWEIGLDMIDEVTGNFDPMIAKIVATAENRDKALALLEQALNKTVLTGPIHNMEFLSSLARNRRFRENITGTHFIADTKDELLHEIENKRKGCFATAEKILGELALPPTRHQFQSTTQNAFSEFPLTDIKRIIEHTYTTASYPKTSCQVGRGHILVERTCKEFAWSCSQSFEGTHYYCKIDGCGFEMFKEAPGSSGNKGHLDSDHVYAPVPGKVIKILAEAQTEISPKDTIVILESMKMEFEVKAPRKGKVAVIHAAVGQQVDADDCLITLVKD